MPKLYQLSINVTKGSLKRKICPNYANLVEISMAPGWKERTVKYSSN